MTHYNIYATPSNKMTYCNCSTYSSWGRRMFGMALALKTLGSARDALFLCMLAQRHATDILMTEWGRERSGIGNGSVSGYRWSYNFMKVTYSYVLIFLLMPNIHCISIHIKWSRQHPVNFLLSTWALEWRRETLCSLYLYTWSSSAHFVQWSVDKVHNNTQR